MRYLIIVLSLFIITCGGGGGGGPTEPTGPQLPTVQNIEFITAEDTPKTFAFMGSEPQNLALTYSISSQPQHGTVSVSGGAATYTPNTNYNGADTFYYIATSTSGNSNIGTVVATITPVNDEPNTMDATAVTDEDNAVDITLEAEEYDGDQITFNISDDPSNGNATISGTTATYTPNQDWYGTDTFTFEAVDVAGKKILNTATATITVNPINDAPVVDDINDLEIQIGTDYDITLTGSDIENDNLTFTVVDGPSKGTVSISGNTATFNGNTLGLDSFTYKANDGTDDSNVATINLRIKFERVYGTMATHHMDEAFHVQETSDNGFIMFGTTTPDGDGGDYDLFLIKTDDSGNEEWSKTYGGSNNEGAYGSNLVTTSDGGFLFGGYTKSFGAGNEDMYLVKTDFDGNEEWSKTYGTNQNDRINAIIEDSNGNYVIAGYSDMVNFASYGYILKLDSSGNTVLDKKIGDININNEILSLIQNNNGKYVISKRNWDSSAEPSTEILILDQNFNTSNSSETIELFTNGMNGIQETDDQGYVIVGSGRKMDNDGDIQIIKMDSNLDFNNGWEAYFGSSIDYGYSIEKTDDGGYIVGGVSDGDFYEHTNNSSPPMMDMILLKIDSSGNREWSRGFGFDDAADLSYYATQISNGNYIIVGNTGSTTVGGVGGEWNIYLVQVDSQGNRIF